MRNRFSTAMIALTLAGTIWPLARLGAAQTATPDSQRGGDARRNPQGLPAIAPAEIQRMLDGYELMQAQEILQLGDDVFSRFLPRLRALQEARRRSQVQRIQILQDLRRMTETRAALDEARLKDSIKALDDLEARSLSEIRQAREALDQVLDPYQQARFRLFEEMMERRKVELVMRARQANRQNRTQKPTVP